MAWTCECGRLKAHADADACDDCLFLDGGHVQAARIIRALDHGGGKMSIKSLAIQAGIATRNVITALRPLLDCGRVERFQAAPGEPAYYALRGRKTKRMPKKQKELKGFERPSIDAIDEAAQLYVEDRDARMALTKAEKERKATLLAVIAEHAKELKPNADGEIVYRYHDGETEMEVTYATTTDVKVRKVKADSSNVVDLDEERRAIG